MTGDGGRPRDPRSAGSAAPGAGGNRPAPSLVIASFLGSLSDREQGEQGATRSPQISVGIIQYPDGGGELFGVVIGKRRPRLVESDVWESRRREFEADVYGSERADEMAEERRAEGKERSDKECARRARCRVRRLCRQYELNHMVTLTFPGCGIHVYDQALRLLQDFIHDHGHSLHRGCTWLAVPELHPSGHGWHWHVLVPGRFTKDELSGLRVGWTEYLRRHGMPPSGGALFTRIDVKRWPSAAHAATYAAKYAGKSFDGDDRQKGRKRYLIPRGVEVPVQRALAGSLDEVRAVIDQIDATRVFESLDDDEWLGPPMVWSSW